MAQDLQRIGTEAPRLHVNSALSTIVRPLPLPELALHELKCFHAAGFSVNRATERLEMLSATTSKSLFLACTSLTHQTGSKITCQAL